jgi:ABC-type amino acid transport substrate-binding protein
MINWHELSDFKKKRIGVVKKYNYTDEFDNYKDFTKVEFANNKELLLGLLKGFVDVIIGDFYTLSFESRESNYNKQLRFLPSSVKKIPRYVAFSKKNKDKSILFKNALDILINSEEYNAIIKKYSVL